MNNDDNMLNQRQQDEKKCDADANKTQTNENLRVFFGGELFTSRHLIGNMFLGEALKKISNGRYSQIYMAQDQCNQNVTHKSIKDKDTMAVIESDIGIFAFEGVEIDSGTVAEFIMAKTLDIPCVVFRTDIRGGSGEEAVDDKHNAWNLMLGFYPRTKIIKFSSINEYQNVYNLQLIEQESHNHHGTTSTSANVISASDVAQAYSEYIAKSLVDAMDEIMKTPPLIGDATERQQLKQVCVKLWNIDSTKLSEPSYLKT